MPFQDKPYQSCYTTRKLLQQHDYKSATNFDVAKYGPNRGAQKKKKRRYGGMKKTVVADRYKELREKG